MSGEVFHGWLLAVVVSVAVVVAVWVAAMWVLNLLDPLPASRRRRWYSGLQLQVRRLRKRWTR